jgi:hypothetical protein
MGATPHTPSSAELTGDGVRDVTQSPSQIPSPAKSVGGSVGGPTSIMASSGSVAEGDGRDVTRGPSGPILEGDGRDVTPGGGVTPHSSRWDVHDPTRSPSSGSSAETGWRDVTLDPSHVATSADAGSHDTPQSPSRPESPDTPQKIFACMCVQQQPQPSARVSEWYMQVSTMLEFQLIDVDM